MTEIKLKYLADKNKQGSLIPGVPNRDLTKAECGRLTAVLYRSALAAPFFKDVMPEWEPATVIVERADDQKVSQNADVLGEKQPEKKKAGAKDKK